MVSLPPPPLIRLCSDMLFLPFMHGPNATADRRQAGINHDPFVCWSLSLRRCELTSSAIHSSSARGRPPPSPNTLTPHCRRSTWVGTPDVRGHLNARTVALVRRTCIRRDAHAGDTLLQFPRKFPNRQRRRPQDHTAFVSQQRRQRPENGSMNSVDTPPVASIDAVAGTIAENQAAVKAPPTSAPLVKPDAGTVRSSVPASERERVVLAPRGRVRGLGGVRLSFRRSASLSRAAARWRSARAAS